MYYECIVKGEKGWNDGIKEKWKVGKMESGGGGKRNYKNNFQLIMRKKKCEISWFREFRLCVVSLINPPFGKRRESFGEFLYPV